MKFSSTYLLALLALCCFSSCEDDDDVVTTMLDVPASYTFLRDGQSTVSFSGQSDRIAMAEELVSAMLDFNKTAEALNDMFRNPEGADPFTSAALNASTKGLRSKVAASADLFATNSVGSSVVRTDFDNWINAQVSEVFPGRNNLASRGSAGQLADGSSVRYVNAEGYEYNQFVAKGLIGALMYDQIANNYLSADYLDGSGNRANNDAATLVEGKPYTRMEHFWDEAYGYVFGASADAANGLADLGSADNFLNEYVGKVNEDPDFAGIAQRIEAAFRAGRAAITRRDYAERDEQAAVIKEALATVIAVRAVFYLQAGKTALATVPVSYGGAFHDLSEAYGFIYSLQFTSGADGDNNAVPAFEWSVDLANRPDGGFWTLSPTTLDRISREIAGEYGFAVTAAAN